MSCICIWSSMTNTSDLLQYEFLCGKILKSFYCKINYEIAKEKLLSFLPDLAALKYPS